MGLFGDSFRFTPESSPGFCFCDAADRLPGETLQPARACRSDCENSGGSETKMQGN